MFGRRGRSSWQLGEEYPQPGEDEPARTFADHLQAQSAAAYPSGTMLRSVQAKNHGAVRAEFVVGDLRPDLQVGLFARPGTYPAWIRFANQNGTPQSDRKRDIRGMSIKVCGVGDGTIGGEGTVDFVMISTNVFVTKDAEDFYRLRRATEPFNLLRALQFFGVPPQFRVIRNIIAGFQRTASPLTTRYFSATPYKFGSRAVKYSAIPHITDAPEASGDDFLREAMKTTLSAGEAGFDFAVQFQSDPRRMPVEDAGKQWSEADSPFVPVATVRIPSQSFDSPEQMRWCEGISFDPWRTFEAHRPIGAVNRARRTIYPPLAGQRRARNHADPAEPTGHETF